MRAWFAGAAFAKHRHDTYAIGLTESGVQSFRYRGSVHSSVPGQAVVLHPDEAHDGYAGTEAGFGYRIVYLEPGCVGEAVRAIAGRACALPFLPQPVVTSARLARAIEMAFRCKLEPLAVDAVILRVSEALMAEASVRPSAPVARVDRSAVRKARELLDGSTDRVVRSAELEVATGLSRFELARQFRAQLGTSPYRYSVMRRLESVRNELGGTRSTVELALGAGFADQAHFTRAFKGAFGVSPGRYAKLRATAP